MVEIWFLLHMLLQLDLLKQILGQRASLSGTSDSVGGPSLQIDGAGNRTMIASNVTPEKLVL